jgi:cell division protein FtsI/penicillin-binding protein 2
MRRVALVLFSLLAAGFGLAGCSGGGEDETAGARDAAGVFLAAWGRADWQALQGLVGGASAAARAHEQAFEDLGVERASFELTRLEVGDGSAAARFTARMRVRGLGVWRYRGALSLRRENGRWVVAWRPSTIHPAFGPGVRFATTRSWPTRAPILAHDGRPLVAEREVIEVGVEPRRIESRRELLRALERLLGADPEHVRADLDRPGVQPDWFIPVTVLRPERYEELKPELYPVPGIVFRRSTARLPPSDEFALHTLGRVGEITAELLEKHGLPYVVGDVVGLSGLELALERRLAGRPSGSVELVDGNGEAVRVLHHFSGKKPQLVRTTLDLDAQTAAERALAGLGRPAALVAVDSATGELRAVAGRPIGEFNRALAGRYPPGSTFKVVTTAALLAHGLGAGDTVACPDEAELAGQTFGNARGTPVGPTSFSDAFAVSCNTAFVQLADTLPDGSLEQAARRFGFGARYELPLAVAGGRFPTPGDRGEELQAAIGQGRVEASPVHMATVAAAVASGRWRPPRLLAGTPSASGRLLPPGVATTLSQLMRLVVVAGTGQAAAVAGTDVHGKTGTAEFGAGDPPSAHAWFIGFREGLAFAVLVEGGGSGGRVAAPIAARFLEALGST